jgi:hypothetical protein
MQGNPNPPILLISARKFEGIIELIDFRNLDAALFDVI